LYVRGTLLEQDTFAIAVIGTRKMSVYGKRMTNILADGLARAGLTIVSGLARGIDGVAHFAALNAGGRTVAVLGGGHRHLFPAEHIPLADNIIESGGAVVSEYPPTVSPSRKTFPQRNRIVSGLSLGVVVIEAPIASGTMITARLASEQGRELFAVPGQADQENSHGCHCLIRDGATLIETAGDIINALGPLTNPLQHPKSENPFSHPTELQLNEIEKEVLQFIDRNETSIEHILEKQPKLEPTQITAAISVLAKKGIIRIKDGTHAARLS
jgi:DNA processing protein